MHVAREPGCFLSAKATAAVLVFALLALAAGYLYLKQATDSGQDGAVQDGVWQAYGRLPLSFEANRGQSDPTVQFLARGSGYTLFLTSTEAVLALGRRAPPSSPEAADTRAAEPAVLRMQLIGANSQPEVVGLEELPTKTNYFMGNDPQEWQTNIPTYARVHYRDVYPGVDLVYYGGQRQLKYDFVVNPGADSRSIALSLEGSYPGRPWWLACSSAGGGNFWCLAPFGAFVGGEPWPRL